MENKKYKTVVNKYGNKVLVKQVKVYLTEHQIDFILKSIYDNDNNKYCDEPNRFSTGVLQHVYTVLLKEKKEISELNNLIYN
jgi:hypothetical protein